MNPKFEEIINYNFEAETKEIFVGDEARRVHLSNPGKPLLSISRITKVFTEHKYFKIPQLNLLANRIIGQLSHRLLDQTYKNGDIVRIPNDPELIKEILGQDAAKFSQLKPEKQEWALNAVNTIVNQVWRVFQEKGVIIKATEKYICNTDFHGYIDILAYVNDEPAVIELKISNIDETKYETKLQLGLYQHLINLPEVKAYELRFNLKAKKYYWSAIDTTDFKYIKHIYDHIEGRN